MVLLALKMVAKRRSQSKPPDYKPTVPRSKVLALCEELMGEDSLLDCSQALRGFAAKLPRSGGYWRPLMQKLAKGLRLGRPAFKVFAMKGNEKEPFCSFSTLPRFTCPGMGDCGNWCYSFKAWRYAGALARQIQNTLLMKHRPDIIRSEFLGLPEGLTLRLYVDGDFSSVADVSLWMEALACRSDIKAYGYSKSWEELYQHHLNTGGRWPTNYVLNLSGGGRKQLVTAERMRSLPIVRGEFLALPIDWRPKDVNGKPFLGNVGFARYDDPAYHDAVREAGRAKGLKVFSCPGRCGSCTASGHACGSKRFEGVTIAIGIH